MLIIGIIAVGLLVIWLEPIIIGLAIVAACIAAFFVAFGFIRLLHHLYMREGDIKDGLTKKSFRQTWLLLAFTTGVFGIFALITWLAFAF